jgi:aminopeptidase N
LGDEAFFSALQSYFQQQRYGIATRANLLAAFESAAGRDLDRLYQEWLFGDE